MCSPAVFCSDFLPKLNECDTDDDVAMRFLKSKEGFEKYLQYLVGQSEAESAVSDKTVHRFFKVNYTFRLIITALWAIHCIFILDYDFMAKEAHSFTVTLNGTR